MNPALYQLSYAAATRPESVPSRPLFLQLPNFLALWGAGVLARLTTETAAPAQVSRLLYWQPRQIRASPFLPGT